jgi:hypothetical protein
MKYRKKIQLVILNCIYQQTCICEGFAYPGKFFIREAIGVFKELKMNRRR